MRWIAFVGGGVVLIIAVVAAIGSTLPRAHKAGRMMRVKRSPGDVWTVVMNATRASSVPVDILENDPPHRLVTRVTEAEKNFGGTWTITIASVPNGSEVTIVEDGWVANPIFRFVSRFLIGHHATMNDLLKQVAVALHEDPVLSGE